MSSEWPEEKRRAEWRNENTKRAKKPSGMCRVQSLIDRTVTERGILAVFIGKLEEHLASARTLRVL